MVNTKRVSVEAIAANTKRVSVEAIAANTKRVTTSGITLGSIANDTWGGTWGGTWGLTWFTANPEGAASPAGAATQRVPAVGGTTLTQSRIDYLLLLEGDESGYLLFEGDMQLTGVDALKLSGDAITVAGAVTKRITGAVP